MAVHIKKLSPNAVKIRPLIKRRGSINQESKNNPKNTSIMNVVIVTLLDVAKFRSRCKDCMSCDCMIKCPYVFLINNYNEKK